MNKKLIKTIASITCGLGIVSSIPFIISNCGSSSEDSLPLNVLPYKYLLIQENREGKMCFYGAVLELVQEYTDNPEAFSQYDTIQIPAYVETARINSLANFCGLAKKLTFEKKSKFIETTYNCFSGSSLKSADFSNCTRLTTLAGNCFWGATSLSSVILPPNLSSIEQNAFGQCAALSSVTFPSSLTTIGSAAFYINTSQQDVGLKNITWDAWQGADQMSLQSDSFQKVNTSGTVTVTNPIGDNDSAKLLEYLKTKGLPEGWDAA